MIVVVDYDPAWPRVFGELRATLAGALGDIALAIEHVGSTSVPGLAAKPVIDIDVVVQEADVALAIGGLEAIGYTHRGDLGIPQREAFRQPPGSPPHHLYVCPEHSPALANHRALRDYLRMNPEAVLAYGALKKQLALRFGDDMDGYVEGKTAFIVDILAKRGLTADTLADIERMNRRPVP